MVGRGCDPEHVRDCWPWWRQQDDRADKLAGLLHVSLTSLPGLLFSIRFRVIRRLLARDRHMSANVSHPLIAAQTQPYILSRKDITA
jgi:hypothetical protein